MNNPNTFVHKAPHATRDAKEYAHISLSSSLQVCHFLVSNSLEAAEKVPRDLARIPKNGADILQPRV